MAARRRRRRRPRAGALGSVSKRDFEAVAVGLCRAGASEGAARELADYFQKANPRFNRERFLDATKRC